MAWQGRQTPFRRSVTLLRVIDLAYVVSIASTQHGLVPGMVSAYQLAGTQNGLVPGMMIVG